MLKLPAQLTTQQLKYGAVALVLAGVVFSRVSFKKAPPPKPEPTPAEVEAFFRGVKAGQLPPVRDALKLYDGLAASKAPGTDWTALHLAGSPEVAELLLSSGAVLEAEGPDAKTPLHAAVDDEREAVIRFLVGRRASLAARTKDSYTPMELAVVKGKPAAVNALLEGGAPLDVQVSTGGDNLLHLAARHAQPAAIEALAGRGLDPNKPGEGGKTPLFIAASTEAAAALLIRGADPAVRAADRLPVVASVIKDRNEPVAAFLLQTLERLDADHIGRALVAAAGMPSEALVNLILERRPEFRWQQEALFAASAVGSRPIADVLASLGAGAAQDAMGRTPLHVASHPDVIEALVKHGLFIDARDRWRRTPLFMAVAQDRDPVALSLLEHGADANAWSAMGDTPLLVACARDDAELVKKLLEKNAEPNTKNRWGVTPLHYAARASSLEIAGLLLEKGADPMARIVRPVVRPSGSEVFPDPLSGQDLAGATPVELASSDVMKGLLLKYKEQ